MKMSYYILYALIFSCTLSHTMQPPNRRNITPYQRFQYIEKGKIMNHGYRASEKVIIFKDALSRYEKSAPKEIVQLLGRIAPYLDNEECKNTQQYKYFKFYDLDTVIPLLPLTIACCIIPHNKIWQKFRADVDNTIYWNGKIFATKSDYNENKAVRTLHANLKFF